MINVNKISVVSNDEAAERILTQAGVLNAARPIPPFDTACFAFFWDEFHILSKCSSGFVRPEDNGWLLIMVPDDAGSAEEIAEFLGGAATAGTVPGTPVMRVMVV